MPVNPVLAATFHLLRCSQATWATSLASLLTTECTEGFLPASGTVQWPCWTSCFFSCCFAGERSHQHQRQRPQKREFFPENFTAVLWEEGISPASPMLGNMRDPTKAISESKKSPTVPSSNIEPRGMWQWNRFSTRELLQPSTQWFRMAKWTALFPVRELDLLQPTVLPVQPPRQMAATTQHCQSQHFPQPAPGLADCSVQRLTCLAQPVPQSQNHCPRFEVKVPLIFLVN